MSADSLIHLQCEPYPACSVSYCSPHPTTYCLANANVICISSFLFSLQLKSSKSFCPQRFSPLHAVAIHDSPSAQNHGLSQNYRANVNRLSPKKHGVKVGRYILQNIFLDFTTQLSPVIKMADLFPSHSRGPTITQKPLRPTIRKKPMRLWASSHEGPRGCCILDSSPPWIRPWV